MRNETVILLKRIMQALTCILKREMYSNLVSFPNIVDHLKTHKSFYHLRIRYSNFWLFYAFFSPGNLVKMVKLLLIPYYVRNENHFTKLNLLINGKYFPWYKFKKEHFCRIKRSLSNHWFMIWARSAMVLVSFMN